MLKFCNNDYENIGVIEKNTLPKRSFFVPFSGYGEARLALDPKDMFSSSRVTSLCGEWKVKVFPSPLLIEPEDTGGSAFSDWQDITVPGCVQRFGIEKPFYVNNDFQFPVIPGALPEYTPCYLYKRFLELEKLPERSVINFLGVASGFTLFVNGREAGYAEVSHALHRFEVTGLLKEGRNIISVAVYKWTSGSFLESQDMFRYNGIFREVYITHERACSIADFSFTYQSLGEDFAAVLTVKGGEGCKLTGRLLALPSLEETDVFEIEGGRAEFTVKSPRLWSAETPHCYKLFISVIRDGEEIECVSHTVGFKTLDYSGPRFLVNGKPIKIKGVNRHDSSPEGGFTVSYAGMRKDVMLMKEYNVNTLRCSHYPPGPQLPPEY